MPRATNRCQNPIVYRHFPIRIARYVTNSRVDQTMPTNRHWPPLAKPPQLGTDDVHAWAVSLDVPEHAYAGLLATLAPDERHRASEYRFDDPRRRYVVARGTLRRLLGDYLDAEPMSIELTIDQNQKPHLASQHAAADLHFNVSHSGDLAMMYHATYPPDFYRALHGLVHAEFRQRRALDRLAGLVRHPQLLRFTTARELVAGLVQAFKHPALRRKVEALARQAGGASTRPTPILIPMLSQQAAAVPSEQPR